MSRTDSRQVLLVDGHSVIFRSYFAFIRNPLRNTEGTNTSAVFGFANMLRKLLEEFEPRHCAVVFDAPGKTFRHEQYKEYKIQRPPTPAELSEQIPIVKEMVTAMGVPSFEVPGVEADDVLGTLAKRFARRGYEVVIVSTDKDMFQLVGGRVSVYDPWKGRRYRADDVQEKLGIEPERVVDYLSLVGDAVDNVPGVRGIGPKRARAILAEYASLEDAAARDARLQGQEEVLRLSRSLVEIDTAVEVDADAKDLSVSAPDNAHLRGLYEKMGFRSLLGDLEPDEPAPVVVADYREGSTVEAATRIAFWFAPDEGLWLTADGEQTLHIQAGRGDDIRRVLGVGSAMKVGIDIKDQIKALGAVGCKVRGPVFDVSIAGWLVDPNRRRYGIQDLALQLHGRPMRDPGSAGRPAELLRLVGELEPQLAAMGLEAVAREVEMPLVSVLARMEERGVAVDRRFLTRFRQELDVEVETTQQRIWELAGTEFNVSSPRQLGKVLFEDLGLRRGKKTKTGYSTSSSVLANLVGDHPVVAEVLRFRELTKLAGTYVRPLLELADGDGRVHAEFNQTGTATGRLSSSNPNIQNIPIRTDIGRRMRGAFVAGRGRILLSADYSQIELRVLAHISGDERLKEAFEKGEDVHVRTAAEVFGIEPGAVTPEYRRLAKVVNFGIIYGMGDYGLASRMDIPFEQARSFLQGYMEQFAGVARWQDRLIEQVKRDGFLRTLSGRMRPVPEVLARNRNVAEAAKRAALNAPIQGSAADIIKRAMLEVEQALADEGIDGGMLVQVHDELLFEVPREQADRAREIIRREMEGAWQLDVPLVVEVGAGRNWEEAH